VATPVPPRLPASERLRRAGVGAWSIIGILILGAIFVWALLKVRVIFPPLVLAILVVYVLNPLVTRLHRLGVPRVAGTLGAYVVVLGGLALVVIALIPLVSGQVGDFSRSWPELRTQALEFVDENARRLESTLNTEIDTTQISCLLGADETTLGDQPSAARCDQVTNQLREQLVAQAGRLTQFGSSLLEVLLVFVVGPLIALYLLIDLPHLSRDLKNLIPESHRDEFVDLGGKVTTAVGGFFRGQLLVALVVGILSALGFRIIGLPFWFVIGAVAGFFNLVPLVGPYIGGALGFFVGLLTGGIGLGLRAAVVELIVQQLDNHFISPNVMRRTVNLHPVTVMLSLLAGSAVAGFWGVLLGVPAVAVAKVTLGHLWATRVLGAQVSPHAVRPGGRAAPSVVPEPAAGADTEGGGDSLAHGEDAVEPSTSPAGTRPPGD
jgi:predicted PurR-regulated permease PerM